MQEEAEILKEEIELHKKKGQTKEKEWSNKKTRVVCDKKDKEENSEEDEDADWKEVKKTLVSQDSKMCSLEEESMFLRNKMQEKSRIKELEK